MTPNHTHTFFFRVFLYSLSSGVSPTCNFRACSGKLWRKLLIPVFHPCFFLLFFCHVNGIGIGRDFDCNCSGSTPRHATSSRNNPTLSGFFFLFFFIYLISLFHLLLHSICHVSAICTLSCFLCVFLSLFIFMLIWLSVFMMSNIRCQTLNTPRFYNKCCCSPIYVVFFVRLRIYLSTVLSPFFVQYFQNISKLVKISLPTPQAAI